MIERRFDVSQSSKLWVVLAGFAVILYGLWQLSNSIAAGSTEFALLIGAGFVAFFVAGRIAGDWRSGINLFFVWLIFEDLVRKYMGNNMYVYFAKDLLLVVTYVSLFACRVRRDLRFFRPPFRYALGLFVLFGVVQMFNPLSPSIFYGVLGIKLYFFYIPLMFVGYALLRGVDDLRRFLVISMVVAAVVSVVGIIQTVIGIDFLNPHGMADIDELGHGMRATSTGFLVARPPSVFVSDGRFSAYLMVIFILGVGTAGFLLLRRGLGRIIVFAAVGLVALATILSGVRGAFVYVLASCLVLPAGMIWGAPKRFGEGYRLIKAIRRSFIFVALAVGLGVMIFPDVVGAHLTYYRETLMPGSERSQTKDRTWDYPLEELQKALADPARATGYGIGTRSLGVQYVSRIMEVPPAEMGVENGYGELIQEFGILGPILWLLWTISLFASACRVMLKLRGTWAFPVALAIVWFSFILLFPDTWGSLNLYQNFITNAYFWVLIGFLFRLPGLVAEDDAELARSLTG